MPSTIIFTTRAPGGKAERVKVSDEPERVVEKLVASTSGFAGFARANDESESVWVNRDQVRMIRQAKEN